MKDTSNSALLGGRTGAGAYTPEMIIDPAQFARIVETNLLEKPEKDEQMDVSEGEAVAADILPTIHFRVEPVQLLVSDLHTHLATLRRQNCLVVVFRINVANWPIPDDARFGHPFYIFEVDPSRPHPRLSPLIGDSTQ
jgi:hypothetical protein